MAGRTISTTESHIGSRLLAARRLRDVSQELLAFQLGVTPEVVKAYEEGENLTAGGLYDMARALQVDVSYFYEGLTGATSCPFSLSNESYLLLRCALQRIAADNEVTPTGHRKRLARNEAINMAREVCETLGWSYGTRRYERLPLGTPAGETAR
jgi:transcriptional regulator with XRE-family HTH domain